MIIFAWVCIVLLALLVGSVIVVWIANDPEDFAFTLLFALVFAVIIFGTWGIGYVAGAWGALW